MRTEKNKYNLAWIIFHVVLVITIIWSVWDRIEAQSFMINNTKNIGYFVMTNSRYYELNIFFHLFRLGVGYLLFFWFIPSFINAFHRHYLKFVIFFVLVFLLEWAFVLVLMTFTANSQNQIYELDYHPLMGQLVPYAIIFLSAWALYALKIWLKYYGNLKENIRILSKNHQLEKQMQSHFIFNSLNQVYSDLLRSNQDDLADQIAELSELYRYLSGANRSAWSRVSDELSLVEKYWDIQARRFSNNNVELVKEISCSIDAGEKLIITFLLINLVENAFEHGISTSSPSFIRLEIHSKADSFKFQLKNSNHHRSGGAGKGLELVKELLELYYGDTYTLDITSEEQEYMLNLELPLK